MHVLKKRKNVANEFDKKLNKSLKSLALDAAVLSNKITKKLNIYIYIYTYVYSVYSLTKVQVCVQLGSDFLFVLVSQSFAKISNP